MPRILRRTLVSGQVLLYQFLYKFQFGNTTAVCTIGEQESFRRTRMAMLSVFSV